MSTKYILHGGYPTIINSQNDKFFQEILSTDKKDLEILLVLWAKESDQWPRKKQEIKNQFHKNNSNKKLTFIQADENNFAKQVEHADIIYLQGGQTLKLLDKLKKFDKHPHDLIKLFTNKTIAAESAGTYILSRWFYNKTEGGVWSGLYLVDVKTICHFIGENEKKLDKYDAQEILLLPKFEYKVFIK